MSSNHHHIVACDDGRALETAVVAPSTNAVAEAFAAVMPNVSAAVIEHVAKPARRVRRQLAREAAKRAKAANMFPEEVVDFFLDPPIPNDELMCYSSTTHIGTYVNHGGNGMGDLVRLDDPDSVMSIRDAHYALDPKHVATEAAALASQIVGRFTRGSRAPATLLNYRTCWKQVISFCTAFEASPLPMVTDTASMILASLADLGYSYGFIRNVRTTIRLAHRWSKLPDPTDCFEVDDLMSGIARVNGTAPVNRKEAILASNLAPLYEMIGETPFALVADMNRALLGIGFGGAFRGSEMAAFNRADVQIDDQCAVLNVRRSKTDQPGAGESVRIDRASDPALCGVSHLEKWLARLTDDVPAIFRVVTRGGRMTKRRLHMDYISRMLKAYADVVDLQDDDVASHSLRAGWVTSAIIAGVEDGVILAHTRKKTMSSVLDYLRLRRGVYINLTKALGL